MCPDHPDQKNMELVVSEYAKAYVHAPEGEDCVEIAWLAVQKLHAADKASKEAMALQSKGALQYPECKAIERGVFDAAVHVAKHAIANLEDELLKPLTEEQVSGRAQLGA